MKEEFKNIKARFANELSPFLEMLSDRKDLSSEAWQAMIDSIELRVASDPEQYLGKDLPTAELTKVIVREIFQEFLQPGLTVSEHAELKFK